MTKISYVAGIKAIKQESPGYATLGEVAATRVDLGVMDYLAMSKGEMLTQLLSRQAKMYAASYPSLKVNFGGVMVNPYTQAQKLFEDAIYKGLHGGAFDIAPFERLSNATGGAFDDVRRAMLNAKNDFDPASDTILFRDRMHLGQGTDPAAQIGEIITLDNCQTWERMQNYQGGAREGVKQMFSKETYKSEWFQYNGSDSDCLKKQEYRNAFNKDLPDRSHQLLYNWVTNDFLEGGVHGQLGNVQIARIAQKAAQHTQGIEVFSQTSTLDKALLTEWIKTAVMAKNQSEGFAPMTPDQVLVLMRDSPDGWSININEGDPNKNFKIGDFGILLGIALIIIAACAGVAAVIQVLQGKEPTALSYVERLFSKAVSPSNSDFDLSDISLPSGTGSGNNTCPTGYIKNAAGLCVPNNLTTPNKTMDTKTMILVGAGVLAAGGIYLATKDNKKA